MLVVVAPSGTAGVRPLVAEARRRGLPAAVITGRGARAPDVAARVAALEDPYDPGALVATACALAGGTPSALVSWDDGAMLAAARAAELLGVGRSPSAGLARARDKHATRQALRAAGLATPAFALIDAAAAAPAVAASVGLPAVIKPLSGSGSLLVKRVADVDGLAAAYRLLAERAPEALDGVCARPVDVPGAEPLDPTRVFLVEGLLRGAEYSVDVLVRDGAVEHVLLLDKFLVDARFFELGFAWPPLGLDAGRERLIRRVVDDAVAALGIDNTTAHVEVIDDACLGPTVIEVNAGRPGGQVIVPLAAVATGIDLCAEHVALALGAPPPAREPALLDPPLATLSVMPDAHGEVVAIHGLDAVSRHPDVVGVYPMCEPGDVLPEDWETFPINVMVAGVAIRERLVEIHAEVSAMVRVETVQGGTPSPLPEPPS
ncbi:MAG TPA: ATP-grasp domain-containing protein [Candidatus Dormibacteraeota bacterium]|nr:ATP-grasp domain-containing protein [Candidatus Dormibacteraeota bacterium]